MSSAPKRGRYGALAVATAQFYNTTGTVPSQLHLAPDLSYLITTQPSCTIVAYEVPSGCTEQDLMGLFSRFGQVKNTKLVCNGRAVLVEFCEISTPTRLVHMAKSNPFYVGTNIVRLEFSTETIATTVERKVAADKTVASEPTRILHLDIAAADYPITVEVIRTICSSHAQPQRVFIGKKNVDRSLEALVEFQSVEEAQAVKQQLDGADIYSGCCSLTVTYSQIPKVHVTKNDSESWDFTGPNAGLQGPLNTSSNQRTLLSNTSTATPKTTSPLMQHPPTPAPGSAQGFPSSAYPPQVTSGPVPQMGYYGMPHYVPQSQPAPPMYGMPPPPTGGYGHPSPYMNYSASMPAHIQRPPVRYHTQSFPNTSKVVILPTPPPTHPVSAIGIGMGHATSNMNASSASTRSTDESVFESMEGVVLMACNLPTHLNCDNLFNLLCLYGNIARIKFLKTRPGCAMIQVGTAEAADLIHRYYDSVCIFGRAIQFYHSKQPELTEHENLGLLDDGSPVMKNYMGDPNNRFRNVIVASRSRILEPSRTLHFFNTPLYITPEDVGTVFTNAGVKYPPRIVIFTSKPGQKTSLGLVEWDTLSEALEALTLANHYPVHVSGVPHPFHMKLAFSPKPISSDRAGQALLRYPAPPLTETRNISFSSRIPPIPESEEPSAAEEGNHPVTLKKENVSNPSAINGTRDTHVNTSTSLSDHNKEKVTEGVNASGDKWSDKVNTETVNSRDPGCTEPPTGERLAPSSIDEPTKSNNSGAYCPPTSVSPNPS